MEELCELNCAQKSSTESNADKVKPKGIFWAFVIFNFALVFIFSWLYLHGVRNLKRWLSKRKTQKGK